MTKIGTTRKLTRVQAIPNRPATNRPILPERSSTNCNNKPTVAETKAQPAIAGNRERTQSATAC